MGGGAGVTPYHSFRWKCMNALWPMWQRARV
jgi:hypothetical protein